MCASRNRPTQILYVARRSPWGTWTNSGFTRRLCGGLRDAGCLYGAIDCAARTGLELQGERWLPKQLRRVRRRWRIPYRKWADERSGYLGRLLRRLPPQTPVVYHYVIPKPDPGLPIRRFYFQDLTVYDAVNTQSYGYDDFSETGIQETAEICREAFDKADGVLTFSSYAADSIARDFGTDRSKIAAIGCGPARSRGGEPSLERYEAARILFVGRRWERKGGPLVLEAFQKVREAVSHATLHIAGPSTPPPGVDGTEGVEFYGMTSDETIARLFTESSMFVMPAVCEAWGMVYTEAADAGMPIAGFRQWALPDVVDDGRSGRLTDDHSPEGLASAMIEMLQDPERMLEMGRMAQRRCREVLDWPHVRDRAIAHIVPEALNGRTARPLAARTP